jgi:hypothetical protein
MKKFSLKKKIKIIFISFFILIFGVYVFINFFIGTGKIPSNLLTYEQRLIIKRYIFPYKLIDQREEEIIELRSEILEKKNYPYFVEQDFKKSRGNIQLLKLKNIKLSNNNIINKYKFVSGFYAGINGLRPGGYLDFHNNNLLVLSSRGIIGYNEDLLKQPILKQIKNNIEDFIGLAKFYKGQVVRDLYIDQDKIYISYLDEIEENCWNTSLIIGDMNYTNIKFKQLFRPKKCTVNTQLEKKYKEKFTLDSSGGRIVNFDKDHILFSMGEYLHSYNAQNKKSINGKILKININTGEYQIISMGHRNPQGLYFDKENDIVMTTEHGPRGGDEINIIEIDKIVQDKPINFGWPISSYGEHYGGRTKKNREYYIKYPLYKSHKEYGFVEPIKFFVPSIGISEITKISEKKFVTSSMGSYREGDKSIYFFELNKEKKLINLEQVKVTQRVRDLKFKDNKLFLFLEEPSAIGVISFN